MIREEWQQMVKKTKGIDRVLISVLLVGVVVTAVSLLRGILIDRQVQVEYASAESNKDTQSGTVTVDVEGSLIHPGVYELPSGSRIKDLWAAAGGLAEKADRTYCEKNINLAEVLKDGQKYYVPTMTDTPSDPGYIEAKSTSKLINVNTATEAQLDTLWGVGPSRAQAIIKNRPYGSLDDLVKKGAVSKQILEKNKEKLTIY